MSTLRANGCMHACVCTVFVCTLRRLAACVRTPTLCAASSSLLVMTLTWPPTGGGSTVEPVLMDLLSAPKQVGESDSMAAFERRGGDNAFEAYRHCADISDGSGVVDGAAFNSGLRPWGQQVGWASALGVVSCCCF